jgi:hypothetical protein
MDPLFYEKNNIDTELKRLRQKIKDLNSRKKDLISQITEYMINHELETYTYNQKEYKLHEKPQYERRKAAEKREEALNIITAYCGVSAEEAQAVYEQLNLKKKGTEISVKYTLK